ncbi:MAG: DUF760 domain-containing protein [Synechococcales cyanobacterium RM1_1_8]|nr:DUF760 domain-containing protein [Synechococcales cyanobacterium RM1_1_8]
MNEDFQLSSGSFNDSPASRSEESALVQYIHSLHPEVVSRLSKPENKDVLRIMEQNIGGLLGHLPEGPFNVEITTNRDHLGRLLASAMMGGYFLRTAEQRMTMEQSLLAGFESSMAAGEAAPKAGKEGEPSSPSESGLSSDFGF